MDSPTTPPPGPRGAFLTVFSGNLAVRVVGLVKVVVAARLIEPGEFGSFVLAFSVLGAVEVTSNPGLRDALIAVREPEPRDARTLWTFLVGKGVVTSALLYVLADPIAYALASPDIAPLIRVLAVVPSLSGALNLGLVLQQRYLNVRPLVRTQVMGACVDAGASIFLAWHYRTASALVVGVVLGYVTTLVASHLVVPAQLKFGWSGSRFKYYVHYARWRFLSNVLVFASTQGDDLVVGRFLGVTAVGHYRMAYRISNAPTTEVVGALTPVAFPALARSSERGQAAAQYARYLAVTAGLSGTLALLVGIGAQPLVLGLLGEIWRPAVVPVAIMSLAGFVRALLSTGGAMFLAAGQPRLDTQMQVIRTITLFASLVLIIPLGVVGAALASLVSVCACVPVWLRGLDRCGVELALVRRTLTKRTPALALIAVALLPAMLLPLTPAMGLAVIGVLGVASTWVAYWKLDVEVGREFIAVTHQVASHLRRS